MTTTTTARDEFAEDLQEVFEGGDLVYEDIASALMIRGYVKADHAEFGLDHKRSDLEFTDEDGESWTDEEDFRAYAEEYGYSMQMVRRHVTAWELLV
ncbi:hypothetical protein SRABI26_02683 [Arthrobacter sp. Bi26]|uniref:hypothetical protein n=1 Tax=Arthrobacter sp. Bi26 TaxID=2822350 RepID=UPI001D6B8195|nr:hypothetical protein [Arthrobacter sp. Bi26]CAH0232446.1 hypothetical protein SRABI26_02683 [Arthrobacter sp. Bi26]